ncbi:hypothetical protein OESDEN_25232 [Oesophagostomum dentatum]|uniref:Tetraspanin family protein n=1 Tax=Oesophagostomum dentatum TaxID=61180 RepID=A0A0B1RVH5_OESDE|nr:hypothetical protein OESDEN_25232 [Oesophagostomum dentatum]
MHVMKVALDQSDPILYHIIHMFHEKLECCGFHGIDDYYAQRQIDYPPPLDGKEQWRHTFRLSNSWITNCSADATSLLNLTHVCYAPEFCCSHGEGGSSFMGACPPAKWDGTRNIETSRRMYKHPCAWQIAKNFYNKALNIMVISIANLMTATVNAIHMAQWGYRRKPPSSKATEKAN